MLKTIAIVGSGPAALMLASKLDPARFVVSIYERNSAPARKFLVAGDGGLNLTHAEDLTSFISRYAPSAFMEPYIRYFDNKALRAWFETIGVSTWVGSSNRVFPLQGMKPAEVLKKMLDHAAHQGVRWFFQHEFKGWDESGGLLFKTPSHDILVKSDIVVYALGGASWPVTGSDGGWLRLFEAQGIHCLPFEASNCAFRIDWPKHAVDVLDGRILKNIVLTAAGQSKAGELVITKSGLEGGALYALSPWLRSEIKAQGSASLFLDLKPTMTHEELHSLLSKPGKRTEQLKKGIRLADAQVALVKAMISKEEFLNHSLLADRIKSLPLRIIGAAPIEEAISTVGGVHLDEVGLDFQLKKFPNHYCIGEMLNWDAPTGGYLLQAAFSMGAYLGNRLNAKTVVEKG